MNADYTFWYVCLRRFCIVHRTNLLLYVESLCSGHLECTIDTWRWLIDLTVSRLGSTRFDSQHSRILFYSSDFRANLVSSKPPAGSRYAFQTDCSICHISSRYFVLFTPRKDFITYRRVIASRAKSLKHETDLSPEPSAEVKNMWNSTWNTSHKSLHAVGLN